MASGKERLDRLLVARGLCPTRTRAQARIMAGEVIVDGHRVEKAGTEVSVEAELRLKGEDNPFVSRGGLKLQGALEAFEVDPTGLHCIDLGASTGGFTDCLLQAGAKQVVAVDVGYGQLATKLRSDPRVEVRERTNARLLKAGELGPPAELVVIDCAFISLELLLPVAAALSMPGALCLPLVKPQFEVGRGKVGKGGVVRDPELRQAAIEGVEHAARELGFEVVDRTDSSIKGPKGNLEALLHLRLPA